MQACCWFAVQGLQGSNETAMEKKAGYDDFKYTTALRCSCGGLK
jgi:hypothetical protein